MLAYPRKPALAKTQLLFHLRSEHPDTPRESELRLFLTPWPPRAMWPHRTPTFFSK